MMIHSSSLELPTWKLTSDSAAVVLNQACSTMVKNFVLVSLFSRLHRVLFANRKLELPKKESMMLTKKKFVLDHSEQPGNCWKLRTSLLNMALQFYMTFLSTLFTDVTISRRQFDRAIVSDFFLCCGNKESLNWLCYGTAHSITKKHRIYTAQLTCVTIRWEIIFDTEPNPPGQPTH